MKFRVHLAVNNAIEKEISANSQAPSSGEFPNETQPKIFPICHKEPTLFNPSAFFCLFHLVIGKLVIFINR